MKCKDVRRSFHYFLDGDLKSDRVVELQEHIFHCASCKAAWQELHNLHTTLHGLPRLGAPKNFTDRVLNACASLEATDPKPLKRIFTWRLSPLMTAAGLLTLFFITVYSGDGYRSTTGTMVSEKSHQSIGNSVQLDRQVALDQAPLSFKDADDLTNPRDPQDKNTLTMNDQKPVPLYYLDRMQNPAINSERLRYAGEPETVNYTRKKSKNL